MPSVFSTAASVCTLAVIAMVLSLMNCGGIFAKVPRGRALNEEYTYEMYVRDFNRGDRTAEEHALRRPLFYKRRDEAIAHNKLGKTWTAGVNDFTDWTEKEINSMRNRNYWGVKRAQKSQPVREFKVRDSDYVPHRVDWRGAVPPVLTTIKDQGQCGSCWAHAATETMESWYAIAAGQISVLSQEQVAQCSPNPNSCGGTGGCNGATHQIAYEYVTNAGGITEEWMYPYTSYYGTTGKCSPPTKQQFFASFNGYVQVARNDAQSTMAAVAQGPLSIVVAAIPFLNYDGGVFSGCDYAKNNTVLDHGVQLVGYGHDAGLNSNYWIVRNSWSTSWGENGFIRFYRAADNATEACGWDNSPSQGIACKGDYSPEWLCGECGLLYDVTHPIPNPLN